ncbi:MAG: hypothetical protein M3Y27_00410 [Acidobacteriota bacterium]|nr:hypothetical protein [Acidobacteriota bacterium]
MTHLSSELLNAYREQRLTGDDLLNAGDHLAECAQCRQLAGSKESSSAVRQLRSEFKPAHATYVQIEAYAEGRLEDPAAKEHLKDCVQCHSEAEDLRKFVVESNIQRRQPLRPRWWWIAAPALAAAMAWLAFTGWSGSPSKPARATAQRPAPGTGLPAELAKLKDDALRTGSVGIPAEVRSLAGTPNVLLGRSPAPDSVALTNPVATATLSDRPLFQWNPIPGAAWYRVGIFDSHVFQVADSGKLTTASWTPERPLVPGRVYAWQLSALVQGRTITAPRPPAPQARFMVLPQAETVRLRALAQQYSGDLVLVGILYARAGALDDAAGEWRKALAQGHTEVEKLLAKHN